MRIKVAIVLRHLFRRAQNSSRGGTMPQPRVDAIRAIGPPATIAEVNLRVSQAMVAKVSEPLRLRANTQLLLRSF